MKMFWLAYRQIKHRPWSALLTLLLVALSVSLIATLIHAKHAYQDKMNQAIKGVDMVVGAKGSPLQLVLSSVYHVDVPTGNISIKDANKISKHPLVKATIPLAYGDSYQGFRIVGTEQTYIAHYKAKYAQGKGWQDNKLQVVLGSEVAELTGLGLGSTFSGSHGLLEGGHEHHDHPYKVVGILEKSGSPLDRLLLTDVHSVHHVHAHEGGASDELTAMFVRFRNPIALMQLPRHVNENTNMQAAVPRYEMERLFKIFGAGSKALNGLGMLLVIMAAMSMFIGLYNGLRQRVPEFALMRAYGASRTKLTMLAMVEGGIIALLGSLLGLLLVRGFILALNRSWNAASGLLDLGNGLIIEELYIVLACVLFGMLIAALPALRVIRNNLDPITQ